MGVPTITSITPAVGLSHGNYLVTIKGANIALPHEPPATGPAGDLKEHVRVLFDGVECNWKFTGVIDDEDGDPGDRILWCRIPGGIPASYVIDRRTKATKGAVDVTILNIDEDGDPISGETVTLEEAFSFEYPDLKQDCMVLRVVRALVQKMRQQVMRNVVTSVHTDYDNEVDGSALTQLSELPAISLSIQGIPFDRMGMTQERDVEDRDDEYGSVEVETPETVDLRFQVVGVVSNDKHLLNLPAAVTRFFRVNRTITVLADPDDATRGDKVYPILPDTEMTFGRARGNSNIQFFRQTWVVSEIDIESFLPQVISGVLDGGDDGVVADLDAQKLVVD